MQIDENGISMFIPLLCFGMYVVILCHIKAFGKLAPIRENVATARKRMPKTALDISREEFGGSEVQILLYMCADSNGTTLVQYSLT